MNVTELINALLIIENEYCFSENSTLNIPVVIAIEDRYEVVSSVTVDVDLNGNVLAVLGYEGLLDKKGDTK
jgi:hypothetical protein